MRNPTSKGPCKPIESTISRTCCHCSPPGTAPQQRSINGHFPCPRPLPAAARGSSYPSTTLWRVGVGVPRLDCPCLSVTERSPSTMLGAAWRCMVHVVPGGSWCPAVPGAAPDAALVKLSSSAPSPHLHASTGTSSRMAGNAADYTALSVHAMEMGCRVCPLALEGLASTSSAAPPPADDDARRRNAADGRATRCHQGRVHPVRRSRRRLRPRQPPQRRLAMPPGRVRTGSKREFQRLLLCRVPHNCRADTMGCPTSHRAARTSHMGEGAERSVHDAVRNAHQPICLSCPSLCPQPFTTAKRLVAKICTGAHDDSRSAGPRIRPGPTPTWRIGRAVVLYDSRASGGPAAHRSKALGELDRPSTAVLYGPDRHLGSAAGARLQGCWLAHARSRRDFAHARLAPSLHLSRANRRPCHLDVHERARARAGGMRRLVAGAPYVDQCVCCLGAQSSVGCLPTATTGHGGGRSAV